MSYPTVLVTGIRATADNADRLNLLWDIFLGTIATVEELGTYKVICDGDSTFLTMTSLAGTLTTGERVYILKVPPNSLFILGPASSAPLQLAGSDAEPPLEAPAHADPVIIGPSPVLDIDSESDIVRTLILEDFFERTVVGVDQWGTPDIGPDWETDFTGVGQLVQVDDGAGQFISTTDVEAFEQSAVQAGDFSFEQTYYSIEMLNIQAVVPAGGCYAGVSARDFDDQVYWEYLGDGTAQISLETAGDFYGPEPIPDVDADQPIDVYIQANNDGTVKVWVALTSVGIDLLDPPIFDEPSPEPQEGNFEFFMGMNDNAGEEASVGFGEIRIWSEPPPPPPPVGLLLEDLFDRTVTGLQEWGTPNTGDPWETVFFGDGQTIQVASDTGQVINDATYDGNPAELFPGVPNLINYSLEVIGMTVVPAASDSVVDIYARDFENQLTIYWFADGTAEAFLYTGLTSVGPVAVPDVTASQPIDIYMRCIDTQIQVWTALTSVGIDLLDPPLFDETASSGVAGPFDFTYAGQAAGEESSISYDEIRIWNEG